MMESTGNVASKVRTSSYFWPVAGSALLLISLVGCARGESVNPLIPTATSELASPGPTLSPAKARQPCEDGTMLVRDIAAIDQVWRDQLEAASEQAMDWHDDAQLVQLRVSCALFGSGFRLQPSFFSAQAQALLAADTGESQPVNLDPSLVESLSIDSIDFERIYEALIEADFTDDLELDPSTGVDIRVNSEQAPFGPEMVPEGAMVAHVSVEQAGLIKDLFVDEQTGKVYRYESPA
jgi:hypothetical protein